MIACVPRKVAAVLGVVACVAGIALVWGAAAEAFTGTPAALRLVQRLRAQTARFTAASLVPTGYIVYCPQIPLGWIDVPLAGCREHARVTEEFDLSRGRVVRVLAKVSARSQASIRSVASTRGWFQLDQGLDCWLPFSLPFVKALLVDYPFPGERIRIVAATSKVIVIAGYARRSGYHELDYVNPETDLIYRVDQFSTLGHKTYRETDRLRYSSRHSRAPATTPICA
jgi:hypothetical protein